MICHTFLLQLEYDKYSVCYEKFIIKIESNS